MSACPCQPRLAWEREVHADACRFGEAIPLSRIRPSLLIMADTNYLLPDCGARLISRAGECQFPRVTKTSRYRNHLHARPCKR